MLLLGIDTSTTRISVACSDSGTVIGEVNLAGGRRHAEQLAPAVRYLCERLDVDLHHLAAVGVGIGPGLFTGLRVGVTTAKVLAQSLRVPVVTIPTLDLIAYPLRYGRRVIVAVLDARRHEVFHAAYRPVPGGVQRVSDYSVGAPSELVAELAALDEEVVLAGDGVAIHRDAFAMLEHAEHAGPGFAHPSAATLVELAVAKVEREEFVVPWEVRPMYLRRSDAEIERELRGS